MITGLMAGVFWAADTVILGIALTMAPFISTEEAVFLAPFVSTFLHDFCSALWMLLYTGIRKQFQGVRRALKTRSGKFILLGALLGGPVGMSGYVAAIHYMGAGYTSIVSSIFPAVLSRAGESLRQYTHQGAQNSSKTGFSEVLTISLKFLLSTVITAIIILLSKWCL